jgi:hypothetical protein
MRVRTAPWTPRWAAGALVAAAVLAGCSDPDQPGTVPRTTPTPSTSSASPSPTSTEDQVEAAVRAYYAELTKAAQTLETTDLKALVDKNCPCYGSAQSIDETARRGQTTPEAEWKVRRVQVHDLIGKTAAAEVTYDVSAYEVLNSAGESVRRFPARKGHVDLSLVLNSESWILTNVFNLAG